MQGVQGFRLGQFEVATVLDGSARRDDMYPRYAVNAGRDEVHALAVRDGLPFPEYEQFFVPAVIDTGAQLVVFDPGFGERAPAPGFGRFRERLAAAGYAVDDVDIVVITHHHPDHIAGLTTRTGTPVFPRAQIVLPRVDFDYWLRGEDIPDFRSSTLALFREVCLPLADGARFIEAGEEVLPGIVAVEAFGHSAGHMAYRVESGGEALVLMGDAAVHFALSLRRPDWHFAMDDDKPAAVASRRRLLGTIADRGLLAVGFHMPFPSTGRIERAGGGFRWVPVDAD